MLWQGYRDEGLLFLAQSDQTVERIVDFGDAQGSTFPLVRDNTTYEMYDNPGPGNFALEVIVDREGVVRFAEHGSTAAELEAAVKPLLDE